MRKRKHIASFIVGLALLGVSSTMVITACGQTQQTSKAVTITSLRVEGAKTEYEAGEKFSREGMTVYAVKSDGSEEIIEDYGVSPSRALKVSDTSVIIYYDEVEVELPITVTAKAITGLELDVSSIELEVNGRKQIKATVLPEDATEKECTYASDHPEIATVNDAGLVTGVNIGSANITVTTKGVDANGKAISKTVPVTIIATPTTGLEIDVDDIILLEGEEKQIGVTVLPTNATNKAVTYESSNATVASVSNTGLVKALKEGEAVIIVKTNAVGSDGQPFKQSFNVSVINSNTKFAVAFRNTDGTLIQAYKADQVTVGEIPAFTAKAPRKASDNEGVYIFRGFDKEIVPYVASTEEVTYTAVYQKRQYTITAMDLELVDNKVIYSVTGTSVADNPQIDLRNMYKGGSWTTETVQQMEPMSYLPDGSWVVKANLLDPSNSFLMEDLGVIYIGKFRFNGGQDEDLKELIRNDAKRYRHTADGEVIEIKDLSDNWDGVTGLEDLSEEFQNAIPAPTWDGLNIAYKNTTVTYNGYEYKMFANADTWNCVSLMVQKEGAIDATVTPQSADVELINNKPYYVVNGTFTGNYSIDEYQKAYGINFQHHQDLGMTDWSYVLGEKTNKFEFDKALSSFDTSTHQFAAKFLVEPSLFGEQIAGVFIAHSVFNGGELDNMKITAGTSVIKTSLFEYKILKNSDTWTICCLQVTALA